MRYLRVRNWERFQNYSDRKPPWIRLYVDLINGDDAEYNDLPDGAKLQLIHLWLLASRHDNRIPERIVTRQRLNVKSPVNIELLLASGFLECVQDASNTQASCNPSRDAHARSVSVSGTASVSFDSEMEFEKLWSAYPRRLGRKAARRHFAATVTTQTDLAAITVALGKYLAHCATLSDAKFIQHGSTWFNNWRDWVDYVPPAAFGPRAIYAEPQTVTVTVDDIRDLRWALEHDDVARFGCTADEAREYLAAVVRDGEITEDAKPLVDWLRRTA